MENINSAADLRKAILDLEHDRLAQERNLKLQWEEVADGFRPVNILKRSFHDIFQRGSVKPDILGSAIALVTGLMTKKLFEGKSPGLFRKTASQALQLGVTALVAKNAPALKSGSMSLFRKIFQRKK